MDDPIVSPLFIYLLQVVPLVRYFILVPSTIAGVIALISWLYNWLEDYYDGSSSFNGNKVVKAFIISMAFVLLSIIIPTRNTMIQIYITKQITPNMLHKVRNATIDVKDELKKDILDIINTIKFNSNKGGEHVRHNEQVQ